MYTFRDYKTLVKWHINTFEERGTSNHFIPKKKLMGCYG